MTKDDIMLNPNDIKKAKFQDKLLAKLGDTAMVKLSKEMSKSFKVLEDHIIQCQENQVEFEQYLKRIEKSQNDFKKHIESLWGKME